MKTKPKSKPLKTRKGWSRKPKSPDLLKSLETNLKYLPSAFEKQSKILKSREEREALEGHFIEVFVRRFGESRREEYFAPWIDHAHETNAKKLISNYLVQSIDSILKNKSVFEYIRQKTSRWNVEDQFFTFDKAGNRIYYPNFSRFRAQTLLTLKYKNILSEDEQVQALYADNRAVIFLIDYCISIKKPDLFLDNSALIKSFEVPINLSSALRIEPAFIQSETAHTIIKDLPFYERHLAEKIGSALSEGSKRGDTPPKESGIYLLRVLLILSAFDPEVLDKDKINTPQLMQILQTRGYWKHSDPKTLSRARKRLFSILGITK